MGATHLLCKMLPMVETEMALAVLTYSLTRVINIVGVKELIKEIQAGGTSTHIAEVTPEFDF